MWSFSHFFSYNHTIIMFIYGLVFFLMGFSILLKNRQHSRFKLAKSLHWLGLFGIIHGVSDWGHAFLPIQQTFISEEAFLVLRIIQIIINALSFMFIFLFGISLWTNTKRKPTSLNYLPAFCFLLWLITAVVSFFHYSNSLTWIKVYETYSRYFIGFPGAIVSGYAVLLQKYEFREFGFSRFLKALKLTATSLIAYGFAAGVIVSGNSIGISSYLNSDLFFQITGLPIEIVRAFIGLILTITVFILLQVFDQEYIHRIQESEKEKARLEERNRLAQDLHDDIIQSLYASNLHLEVIKHLINKDPQLAVDKFAIFFKNRNTIINQIREYIGELKRTNEVNISLQKRIENLINELNIKDNLHVDLDFTYTNHQLSLTALYHLTLVLKEAISNVVKHAQAKNLNINVNNNEGNLYLEVIDDGIGFNPDSQQGDYDGGFKQGLKNIKDRVELLNGSFEIQSTPNKGTKILIKIPF